MKQFREYVGALEGLVQLAVSGDRHGELAPRIEASLNGQAYRELRRLVPLPSIRRAGAFFTGAELAVKVADRLRHTITDQSVICDPACGVGDLLLAGARCMPVGKSRSETVGNWSGRLIGRDLHLEFVDAARQRLALLAIDRGAPLACSDWNVAAFGGVKVGCGLTDPTLYSRATHVLLNPPFGQVPAPTGCRWGTGLVSEAALFLEACVGNAAPETRIITILPDVLRSGGRYGRWREIITSRSDLVFFELIGQFDRWTDVDVFLAELVVKQAAGVGRTSPWYCPVSDPAGSVGSYFDVSVGAVVAYRDEQKGPWVRYIQARGLPAWAEVSDVEGRRRFRGRLHTPPFVVVRRTSRVGDRNRAVATVIRGAHPVAVENHLVVLSPTDGHLSMCHRALTVLRAEETDAWLNQRIRCRHLTTDAVRSIPFRG